MKSVNLDYSTFWTFVSSKGLLPQYTTGDSFYSIFATEGTVSWETIVAFGSSDATDFETNHKTSCNQPLEIKAGPGRPIRVSASPQPDGTVQHWKGFQLTVPASQTSAYIDVDFAQTVYLRGGNIASPAINAGDYVSADVLIAANDAVYISGIISNAYLITDLPISFESNESMAFPTSVKLRITLTLGSIRDTDTISNILVSYFE